MRNLPSPTTWLLAVGLAVMASFSAVALVTGARRNSTRPSPSFPYSPGLWRAFARSGWLFVAWLGAAFAGIVASAVGQRILVVLALLVWVACLDLLAVVSLFGIPRLMMPDRFRDSASPLAECVEAREWGSLAFLGLLNILAGATTVWSALRLVHL